MKVCRTFIQNSSAGFKSYQESYGIDPNTGKLREESKSGTKVGQSFDSTQHLHRTAATLIDCKDLLRDAFSVTSDKGSSRKDVRDASKSVEKVIHAIDIASKTTKAAANKVAPIPQSGYAFQRLEKMREHEIMDESFSRPTKIMKVVDYISASYEKPSPRVVTPTNASASRPRSSCRIAKLSFQLPSSPLPSLQMAPHMALARH